MTTTLLGLAACGSDTLTIHGAGTKLVALQTAGTWQTVSLDTNGDSTVAMPGEPFLLASVCADSGYADYYVDFAGPGVKDLDLACSPTTTVEVSLRGSSTLRATLYIYPLYEGTSWSVAPGTYDVFAYDTAFTPPLFDIQRGISITQDTELVFDLAATGKPLEAISLTSDAQPSESASTASRFYTAGGTRATIRTSDGTRWRVPASAMQAGDHQIAIATAQQGAAYRSATRELADSSLALTLPPRLDSATADSWRHVSWHATAPWDTAFYYMTDVAFSTYVNAFVHPEWIEASGPTSELELPDPNEIPGWQAEWNPKTAVGTEWNLGLAHTLSKYDSDEAGWYVTTDAAREVMPRRHRITPARL